ncbi:YybH family protein [Pseudonocardia charpentierae]|uniref:SgcJ/EcaC family oxidoreductase n=1 Tax=Pseudonocardia charpentierae TaxID=3075545 RepID=A0ABU2NJU4_9PSEU|nr:SgcJ/EcaC family oxidoreductase [Pseudonocardia sp. DSM 45834]MDT0353698.1 SgcJ/EcaC family oxidoreductase [Pseudonocardia sp. DSM 45834]
MPVQDPRQLHQAWEKAYHDGDVGALVEFYEPDGTVFPQPGSPVTGHAAIREALVPFVALRGQMQLRTSAVIENGDLALVYGDWSLTGGTDPDGNSVNMEGRSTEIMRRQSDGSWRDVIDDPYSQA